jgi:predicted metal-dependent peptidase
MLNAQTILDEVARTGINLLLREPFYAHLLGSVNKEITGPGHPVESLAVGMGNNTFILYVNADFWQNQLRDPDHRYGVLKHEMLHLIFKHLLLQEPDLDTFLLNIAFDLVVNQYIERKYLPEDSIFLESFPDLNLKAGQTWYYYYKAIENLQQGADGEFAGTPSADNFQQIKSDSHGLERHQPWREVRSKSELEKSVAETHVESLLRAAHQRTSAHAWGAMPGDIRDLLPPPLLIDRNLNWRLALRLFAGSAGKTRLQNTLKRPSKRYGTTPGIKIRREKRLIVAVDTSGSVGQIDLDVFFKEIFFLWRAGAVFEIVECDTKINARYAYKGHQPQAVSGRGGTDFNQPLEAANRERPDGLIYFTDGFAGPTHVVPQVPVLWVITKQGLDASHPAYRALPGRKIKLDR